MWFVTLVKLRRPIAKSDTAQMNKALKDWASKGIKLHQALYTLGRYDSVWISEAPNEKTQMQFIMSVTEASGGLAATETMVAVSRDEAISWLK